MSGFFKGVHIKGWLLNVLLIFGLYQLHVLPSWNSMINFKGGVYNPAKEKLANDYLQAVVAYHKEEPAFARRPFTSWMIEAVHYGIGLSWGESFTGVNFLLLFLTGWLVYYLALLYKSGEGAALLSLLLFYLSASVLFAFFPTNYSYDEPLQYFFLLLTLIHVERKRWLWAGLFFTGALIARENSLLLYPAFVLFLLPGAKQRFSYKSKAFLKQLGLSTIPIFLYLIFVFLYSSYHDLFNLSQEGVAERFSVFRYNFQNRQYAVESLVSGFLVLGWPLYLLFYTDKNSLTDREKRLIPAVVLSVVLNTIVVLLMTKARELRLFALPLIFLWPLLGKCFLSSVKRMSLTFLKREHLLRIIGTISVLLVLLVLVYLLAYNWYLPTGTHPEDHGLRFYLWFSSSFVLVHGAFRFVRTKV